MGRSSSQRRLAGAALAALLLLALFWVQQARIPGRDAPREGCLACHQSKNDPDPSHPIQAFGCVSCHLGNPHALDADRAHAGMVVNPGDLRVADATCGQQQCHPELPVRVRSSVMSSNAGILNTLYYNWERPELAAAPRHVAGLLATGEREFLYEDHFAKLCGVCHFWNPRAPREGEPGQRGGGCSGCHVVTALQKEDEELRRFTHPELSTRIPSDTCVRCHNRSARAGLTYQGLYESAGYGTPYAQGRPGTRRLSGGRFHLDLPADVHHQQGGMDCIDCHTQREVMGDGTHYQYMEEQLETRCEHCHLPEFSTDIPPQERELAARLVALNRTLPPLSPEREASAWAAADRGSLRYTLRREGEELVQYRKRDGKRLVLKPYDAETPYHAMPGHERLSCQACHSRVAPQCYGCHLEYQAGGSQLDALAGRETPGRWTEGRGFMRFESPILALNPSPRTLQETPPDVAPVIQTFTPCQVLVSHFDAKGRHQPELDLDTPHMTPLDPHSTRTEARGCQECHSAPKALGLGEGALQPQGMTTLLPSADGADVFGLGLDVPADAYTDPAGRALQGSSRPWRRPFTAAEQRRILAVGACLPCHKGYEDPLWRNYAEKLSLWSRGLAPACEVQP